MSMVINTNTASLIAQAAQAKTNNAMETAMERLSTGKRINSASDDAAGMAMASRVESQIRGLTMAVRNAGDASSLIDTAEAAMAEQANMLQRMRELAIQSSNGTNSVADRLAIQDEVSHSEVNWIEYRPLLLGPVTNYLTAALPPKSFKSEVEPPKLCQLASLPRAPLTLVFIGLIPSGPRL